MGSEKLRIQIFRILNRDLKVLRLKVYIKK